jgi:hypothetical protein
MQRKTASPVGTPAEIVGVGGRGLGDGFTREAAQAGSPAGLLAIP